MSGDRMPWHLAFALLLALMLWTQPTAAAPTAACVVREVGGQSVGEVVINGEVALRIRVPAGGLDVEDRCDQVAARLQRLLTSEDIVDPKPGRQDGQVVILDGNNVLVTVTGAAAEINGTNPAYLAWQWSNQLRDALGLPLLDESAIPSQGAGHMKPVTASWYGQAFAGRRTASGELFVPDALTAAHRTLPFNTILRVVNPATGAQTMVRVNDRGPWVGGRDLDLSWGAAAQLGIVNRGVGQVLIEVVRLGDG